MFLGREKELRELNWLYSQNQFQLLILYGRRRVGKTTLLKEFCKNKPAIFYSAEQTNDKMNLEKFSGFVFRYYDGNHLEPFISWEKSIRYINDKQKDDPLILVFDEFPYLANSNPDLMSVLQHLIDHNLKDGKIFMVLSGSYMSFMEKEVLNAKSSLFGRQTRQMHLKSFDYLESSSFLEGFSKSDQLLLYAVFGGTAMYLQQIAKEQPVFENIKNLFLKPTGYLYEEPLMLLRQEVQEPGIYNAIIEAIAKGAKRSNEISVNTGEETAKCIKYMTTLRGLGILYKEIPFGEKESARKSQYGISDQMFRFWYRYVAPNKTFLETDAFDIVWNRRIEKDLDNYMDHAYKIICKEYLLRKNSRGELPVLFTQIGHWWGNNPIERKETEIHIIAQDEQDYLFCECKWRNEPLDYPILSTLKNRADIFRKKRNRTWYVLFSKSGFSNAILREAEDSDDIILVSLDDLFKYDK